MKKKILATILTLAMVVTLTPSSILSSIVEVKADPLPSVEDARYINPNLTPVRNQGALGLCWAYSTIAACEAELVQNNGADKSTLDLSELQLGYFGFNRAADLLGGFPAARNQLGDSADINSSSHWSNAGHNQYAAINTLAAWSGVAPESSAPYDGSNPDEARTFFDEMSASELTSLAYSQNLYHLENAFFIDSDNQMDVKQAILDYGGAIMSFHINPSYTSDAYMDLTNYSLYQPDFQSSNHEVLIVGWDDGFNDFENSASERPNRPGAWRVKNSWGDTALDDGYFWISYEDATISRWMYAYDMEPASKYDNNYQYECDNSGVITGANSNTTPDSSEHDIYSLTAHNRTKEQAANVFTVKANAGGYEILEAVSFLSYAPNGNYTIYIYKDLTDDMNPESGVLVDTITGSYTNMGYYTISTTHPIELDEGSKFSVMVENRDSDGKLIGISKANREDLGITNIPLAGQSFELMGDYRWSDVTSMPNGSAYQIKAFTKNVSYSGSATGLSLDQEECYISTIDTSTYLHVMLEGTEKAEITWNSDNTGVAEVTASGRILPVAEGECTITASANGLSDTCTVYVCQAPATVSSFGKTPLDQLTWDKVEGADGYQFYVSFNQRTGFVKASGEFDASKAKMIGYPTGLIPGKTYYVKVAAYKEVSGYKIEGEKTDYRFYTTPIDAPQNVRVTSATADSITLAWDPVVGAEHYDVRYSTEDGYHSSSTTETSFTVEGLEPLTSYDFQIWSVSESLGAQKTYSIAFITAETIDEHVPYNIAYNANGGTGTTSAQRDCKLDQEITLRSCGFKRSGYTFLGWNTKKDGTGTTYAAGSKVTNLTNIDGATVTLYAQWAKTSYSIVFNSNGGSGTMKNLAATYNKSIVLTANAFTRKGYTFVGWATSKTGDVAYKNKESVKNLTKTGTITLYAKWTKNKYLLIYGLNGGKNNAANPAAYYVDTANITLKNPTRTGYTFGGWYADAKFKTKVTVIKKGSIGHKALYAKWTVNTYNIAYNANGGTGKMAGKTGIKYGSSVTLASNTFKRKGYTFLGWSTTKTGKVLYKNKAIVKNLTATNKKTVTLYAVWTKTKFTIKYNLNGGTNHKSNPASFYFDTATFTLKTPTKTGYTFGGWYADAKFKTKVTYVAKGTLVNKTVYAKWTANTYTISFNANGGTGTMKSLPATYAKALILTANTFKKTGYLFAGWNTKADGTGTTYANKASVKNLVATKGGKITLYAMWKSNIVYEPGKVTLNVGDVLMLKESVIDKMLVDFVRENPNIYKNYHVNDCILSDENYSEKVVFGALISANGTEYERKFRNASEWEAIDAAYRTQMSDPNGWSYVQEGEGLFSAAYAIRLTASGTFTITIPGYILNDAVTDDITITVVVR